MGIPEPVGGLLKHLCGNNYADCLFPAGARDHPPPTTPSPPSPGEAQTTVFGQDIRGKYAGYGCLDASVQNPGLGIPTLSSLPLPSAPTILVVPKLKPRLLRCVVPGARAPPAHHPAPLPTAFGQDVRGKYADIGA